MNKTIKILRWIGVLPLGILSAIAAFMICKFLYGIWGIWNRDNDYLFELLFLIIFSNGVFGYVFVYAGSFFAPNFKKTTSIVLATTNCVCVIGSIIYAIMTHTITTEIVLGDVANFIGSILGSWSIHESIHEKE